MKILSITNHSESSVALLANGNLHAVSEERFTRVKNQNGLPLNAIEWVLQEAKINLEECDRIIYCSFNSIYPTINQMDRFLNEIVQSRDDYTKRVIFTRVLTEVAYNVRAIDEFNAWARRNNIETSSIYYLDHHEAHARSVLEFYQIQNAQIFTCDGKGGFISSAVWNYSNGLLTQTNFNSSINSLGYFYGNCTIELGYRAERHEGKLTGLAAYSDTPVNVNEINPFIVRGKMIEIENIRGKYIPFFNRITDTWMDLTSFNATIGSWTREETAASAQNILENTVISWIEQNTDSAHSNICLSGGVFANVRLNQKIREKFPDKTILVNPCMSDLGLVLGGIQSNTVGQDRKPTLSLGPSFCDARPLEFLNLNKFDCVEIQDIDELVKLLIEAFNRKSPIGVFEGRSEFGPRALCHRSIIYPATDPTCNEMLNGRMNRSDFMPFAPVVPDFIAASCFVDYCQSQVSSRFMTMTYECTALFKANAPAVVHVDGSARPQVLFEEDNPWFYSLLTKYLDATKELCLINTSFNNHEEPIVCTPIDALSSLERMNVDGIIFERRYFISRKKL